MRQADTIGPLTRLLLVDDDAKLVRVLRRGLEREGYEVDVAFRGDDGLACAIERTYDALVLDVMLPGLDGFAVCERLRAGGRSLPVLMLTARTEVTDRIRGLDGGADDYLVKPFDFGELLARLRALIRRGPPEPEPVATVGDLELDAATHVVSRGGDRVELTAREFAVLQVLAQNAGRVVPRNRLIERVWEEDPDVSPNIADVYVGYLRRKLERPSGPRLIRTVRGVGFVLELP
jgi:two-component system OmpR family response regulator